MRVDGNHPLAGQYLNFAVEITEVREASDEEVAHGHVHGPAATTTENGVAEHLIGNDGRPHSSQSGALTPLKEAAEKNTVPLNIRFSAEDERLRAEVREFLQARS